MLLIEADMAVPYSEAMKIRLDSCTFGNRAHSASDPENENHIRAALRFTSQAQRHSKERYRQWIASGSLLGIDEWVKTAALQEPELMLANSPKASTSSIITEHGKPVLTDHELWMLEQERLEFELDPDADNDGEEDADGELDDNGEDI